MDGTSNTPEVPTATTAPTTETPAAPVTTQTATPVMAPEGTQANPSADTGILSKLKHLIGL